MFKIARKFGLANCWNGSDNIRWLDRYTDQKVILLNEFRASRCPLDQLLEIGDKHPVNRSCKGVYGGVDLVHNYVIVSSAHTPQSCYTYHDKNDYETTRTDEKIG